MHIKLLACLTVLTLFTYAQLWPLVAHVALTICQARQAAVLLPETLSPLPPLLLPSHLAPRPLMLSLRFVKRRLPFRIFETLSLHSSLLLFSSRG